MMINAAYKPLFIFGLTTLLIACDRGGDGIPQGNSDFVGTDDPDKFLQFINPQSSLPANTGYQLKVGTFTPNQTGNYTATITLSNGTEISCSGSWSGTSGPDANDTGNSVCTTFDMPVSGGASIDIISNTVTCPYILNKAGDPAIGTSLTGCITTDNLVLPESRINFDEHGAAYYTVIDPDNTRTTLNDWAAQNGFDFDNDNPNFNCSQASLDKFGQCGVHVQFRDTKDLGYGRDMYARREDRCLTAPNDPNASCSLDQIVLTHFAVYVKNFQVDAIPGLQYSALNYQSLIDNDLQWHFGSNAIEFSTYPYGPGEPSDGTTDDDGLDTRFTKFYTFLADKTNFSAPETRLDSVNLDSRGFRSMPGPCISCHGGKTRPLLPDGKLSPPYPGGLRGDTQAKIQAIEVNSVGFPNPGDPIPPEQEAGLKFINQAIRDSYLVLCQQNDDGNDDGIADDDGDCTGNPGNVATGGKWNPTQPMEWLAGSYGNVDASGNIDNGVFKADAYDSSYVPSGWQPNLTTGTPPAGADTLFLEVIKPNCLVCHNKRSSDNQLSDSSNGAINFGSYESFITHSEQIERYIYDKGLMPLGILNFDQFWDNISPNKASLLGSYLPNFHHGNADGTTLQPGRAIAQIAAPGITRLAPTTISAAGSSFSDSFNWEVTSTPAGSTSTSLLSSTSTERTVFTPDVVGDYNIRLTTSNTNGNSSPVTLTITVDETVTLNGTDLRPLPADIRFDPHIKNVLQGLNSQNLGGTTCQNCHSAPGTTGQSVRGVPLFYTDAQVEGRDLYLEVIQRVNFSDPLESWLLRRPSGNQHPGGCLGGFDIYPGDETALIDRIPACAPTGITDDRRNYDLFLSWILEGGAQ